MSVKLGALPVGDAAAEKSMEWVWGMERARARGPVWVWDWGDAWDARYAWGGALGDPFSSMNEWVDGLRIGPKE